MIRPFYAQVLIGLILTAGSSAQAGDWPMWKYDSGRTNSSPHALPSPLHLQWVRKLPHARRAWRDKSNYKLFFDASYQPVVAGKLMFVGSMNTDSVTAYSTETGAEKWRFYTNGPVRFAPVAYKEKVYAGSDDGHLYCLDALTGKLVWKKRGGPSDHKILGNGRLIGMWPFRGGPVIHNDVLYCAAGIWPFMGTFIYALDPATGKEIWCNSGNGSRWGQLPHRGALSFSGIAPQGYLAATDGFLVIPGGRGAPGTFSTKTGDFLLSPPLRGKQGIGGCEVSVVGKNISFYGTLFALETWKIIRRAPRGGQPTGIQAGGTLYRSEKNAISALKFADTKAPTVQWQVPFEGRVSTMLAADDRLFVVTSDGTISCFGPSKCNVVKHQIKQQQAKEPGSPSAEVRAVLKNCSDLNGYCVVLGADADVVRQLLARSKLHIVVVDPSPVAVTALREELDASGLYGKRVSALMADPFHSGLPPYLANALVLTAKQTLDAAKLSAMFNVLRPYGGVAVLTGTKQTVETLAKSAKLQKATATQIGDLCLLKREGALPGSASWTHQYADAGNSVISKDKLVKPPFGLLWFGGPTNDAVLPRHGHGPNPQVVGGRIVIEGPNMLRSLDAYTGRLLWQRQFKGVGHYYDHTNHQPGANEIGSNYVSLEDAVYLLYKEKCMKLNPATGETTKEFTLPVGKDGKLPVLGSLRTEGDFLVLTSETLGISIKPDVIPVKDGQNVTLEDVKTIRVRSGKGVTILEGKRNRSKYGIIYDKAKLVKKDGKMVPRPDGKPVKIKARKGTTLKIDRFLNLSVGSCKRITIAEGRGITVEAAKGVTLPASYENNIAHSSSSRTLTVLDRHSGKVLWSRQAVHGFRHNAVIAAGDYVYCLDKLSRPKVAFLARRGVTPPKTSTLLALDIRTGNVIWQTKEDVFGTWLGYSIEHDVLIQCGSAAKDRPGDEVSMGVVAYQGKDGKVLWQDLQRKHSGPLMLRRREIISNGGGGIWDLFTGKSAGWSWTRNHGCNTAIGGEHVLTFRSGAAGYYDLTNKGGTGNLGGFKSGCSSNLIPADGLLAVPDYTRTCSCSYPNQTSLALRYMPEAEIWTFSPKETPGRLGINFGAPGDRVSETGTLWTEFPLAGSPALKRGVKADGKPFRHHSALFSGKAETWIGASGIEGVRQISVTPTTTGPHTVRLYFAEPDANAKPGSRVFSVSLGERNVLRDLDIVKIAGGPRKLIVKELQNVQIGKSLVLSFAAEKGNSLICGVEIVSKQATATSKR